MFNPCAVYLPLFCGQAFLKTFVVGMATEPDWLSKELEVALDDDISFPLQAVDVQKVERPLSESHGRQYANMVKQEVKAEVFECAFADLCESTCCVSIHGITLLNKRGTSGACRGRFHVCPCVDLVSWKGFLPFLATWCFVSMVGVGGRIGTFGRLSDLGVKQTLLARVWTHCQGVM